MMKQFKKIALVSVLTFLLPAACAIAFEMAWMPAVPTPLRWEPQQTFVKPTSPKNVETFLN